ncbi:hypothetical protein [Solimonas sp. K1W22B-7]|uniref:hypothetical protein n=1 Tax=Solimonas sp. K1W22B-7 TaxID=2303331 RepID=UPI0013C48057|nr:hypothetical protein [Solimonas sp. K1W22B-7]
MFSALLSCAPEDEIFVIRTLQPYEGQNFSQVVSKFGPPDGQQAAALKKPGLFGPRVTWGGRPKTATEYFHNYTQSHGDKESCTIYWLVDDKGVVVGTRQGVPACHQQCSIM